MHQTFTPAGAKSLVMSLWSVPDQKTQELMVQLYKNVLSGTMNRYQALRQAALQQMQIVKERYGSPHPFYWSAVVGGAVKKDSICLLLSVFRTIGEWAIGNNSTRQTVLFVDMFAPCVDTEFVQLNFAETIRGKQIFTYIISTHCEWAIDLAFIM